MSVEPPPPPPPPQPPTQPPPPYQGQYIPPPPAMPPSTPTGRPPWLKWVLGCGGCAVLLLLALLGTCGVAIFQGAKEVREEAAARQNRPQPGPNDPVDRSGQYIAISNGHYSIKGTNDIVKGANGRGKDFISSYAVKEDKAWLLVNPEEWDVMTEEDRLNDLRLFARRSWMRDMGITRSYFLLRGKEIGQIVKTGPDQYEWQPKE